MFAASAGGELCPPAQGTSKASKHTPTVRERTPVIGSPPSSRGNETRYGSSLPSSLLQGRNASKISRMPGDWATGLVSDNPSFPGRAWEQAKISRRSATKRLALSATFRNNGGDPHSQGEPPMKETVSGNQPAGIDRPTLLTAAAAAAAAAGALLAPTSAADKRDWTGKRPVRYPDPDIVVLDQRFAKYKIGNSAIQRLHTGMLWAE